jgi:hypothetical protein
MARAVFLTAKYLDQTSPLSVMGSAESLRSNQDLSSLVLSWVVGEKRRTVHEALCTPPVNFSLRDDEQQPASDCAKAGTGIKASSDNIIVLILLALFHSGNGKW